MFGAVGLGDHDGGEENVEQLTWQLILYDKHSHEHMHRPIGRMLDLETFQGEMFCGSLYSAVQKSPIAVEGCRATCEICPELWLLWLLCMAMTFAIVYGSKSEFADVCQFAVRGAYDKVQKPMARSVLLPMRSTTVSCRLLQPSDMSR